MEETLSRKERKRLAREERKLKKEEAGKTSVFKKYLVFGVIFVLTGFFLWWLLRSSPETVPGETVEDMGRDHVTDIAGINYNSNPPTSGSHFAVWAKKGVYDRLISDGYLIHSLEHGYVIISYDCTKPVLISKTTLVRNALAHDEPAKESTDSGELLKHMKLQSTASKSWFGPDDPPDVEVELPDKFLSDECKGLVSKLSESAKAAERVIVVPRTDMDTLIALTAWGKIDKMDKYVEKEIKSFIKAYHNRGPEKTME